MDILLINKNPIVSKLTNLSAKKAGYRVDEIESIDSLVGKKYEIIIVDNECYSDGLLHELKNMVSFEKIGYIYPKNSDKKDGFSFYLQKPFLPTELVDLLIGKQPDLSEPDNTSFAISSTEETPFMTSNDDSSLDLDLGDFEKPSFEDNQTDNSLDNLDLEDDSFKNSDLNLHDDLETDLNLDSDLVGGKVELDDMKVDTDEFKDDDFSAVSDDFSSLDKDEDISLDIGGDDLKLDDDNLNLDDTKAKHDDEIGLESDFANTYDSLEDTTDNISIEDEEIKLPKDEHEVSTIEGLDISDLIESDKDDTKEQSELDLDENTKIAEDDLDLSKDEDIVEEDNIKDDLESDFATHSDDELSSLDFVDDNELDFKEKSDEMPLNVDTGGILDEDEVNEVKTLLQDDVEDIGIEDEESLDIDDSDLSLGDDEFDQKESDTISLDDFEEKDEELEIGEELLNSNLDSSDDAFDDVEINEDLENISEKEIEQIDDSLDDTKLESEDEMDELDSLNEKDVGLALGEEIEDLTQNLETKPKGSDLSMDEHELKSTVASVAEDKPTIQEIPQQQTKPDAKQPIQNTAQPIQQNLGLAQLLQLANGMDIDKLKSLLDGMNITISIKFDKNS